jgi:hypothetical protein
MWTVPGIRYVQLLPEVFLVAMKLGEMLVSEGKITPEDLEDTLKGQAIFGGRFGTNLIEMGILDELELTRFLSQKAGFPHASAERLMNIAPQVIRLLPEEAARKYRVVPLALNNRKLSLAMADPEDFATIDEISFVTGYMVVPLVTPEIRLVCALEKYYNIKRELRYLPIAGGGRKRARVSPPRPFVATPPPVLHLAPRASAAGQQDEHDIINLTPLDDLDCLSLMKDMPPSAIASGGLPLELQQDFSLDATLQGLVQATDRHQVAELIVGYAARRFRRAALFLIKGNQATGWIAQTGTKPRPGFNTLKISLHEPSVLKTVAEGKSYYLGALPSSPSNSMMCAALGGDPPPNQLLVPLIMMGRVVAILYMDGSSRQLEESIPEVQKLLSKASLAFEIIILKSKILLT